MEALVDRAWDLIDGDLQDMGPYEVFWLRVEALHLRAALRAAIVEAEGLRQLYVDSPDKELREKAEAQRRRIGGAVRAEDALDQHITDLEVFFGRGIDEGGN